jgi:zinc/manganese transport system substrate-binding protein
LPRLLARILPILMAALVVASLLPSTVGAQRSRPVVVATHSILGDIVGHVGRDQIELTTLVGPNGDTHEYQPVPADAQKLIRAHVIFENGLGFESWLPSLYNASQTRASRVEVTARIPPVMGTSGAEAGEPDPHFWFDVNNVISAVGVVRDTLSQLDPAGESIYWANADAYIDQLQELDSWIVMQVTSVPLAQRKLVTTHDAFGYLANRYGFEILGTALRSFSTEAEPTARQTADLVQEIRNANVRVIFPESISNPALMAQIAREAGVTLGAPLYSDALSEPNGPAPTYINLMYYDVGTMVASLR